MVEFNRASSFGIADAFVDGGECGLVFLINDGSRLFEVRFLSIGHNGMLALVYGERDSTIAEERPVFGFLLHGRRREARAEASYIHGIIEGWAYG